MSGERVWRVAWCHYGEDVYYTDEQFNNEFGADVERAKRFYIKFIEYAAYERLVKERDEWKRDFNDCNADRVKTVEELFETANQRDEARAEVERLRETLSYLPKVPTQPYEKELAQENARLREALTLIADRSPRCDCMDAPNLAREALEGK